MRKTTTTKRERHYQDGFSLIELLIVIVVIGIMAALTMQSMDVTVEDVRRTKTEREMEILANAIVGNADLTASGKRADFGYVGDVGAFPPNINALYSNPGGYGTWNGPYIPSGFAYDSLSLKTDEWGQPYIYSGGLTISSTGSGSTISKKIADASSDYLLNTFRGAIRDAEDSLPGATRSDSVNIVVSIPSGHGGTISKIYHPDADGRFTLDSLPVGQHPLRIIYTSTMDTLMRYLTILPRHKSSHSYKFASAYFSSGGGGGGSPSLVEILRPSFFGLASGLNDFGCIFNWYCVDEEVSDNDATYVRGSGNPWRNDLYSCEDPSVNTGTIDSVVVCICCRSSGSDQQVRTGLNTYLHDYEGDVIDLNGVTTYTVFSTTYTVNPFTHSPWAWFEVRSMQIGVHIKRQGRCTQVWAEVYYTEE